MKDVGVAISTTGDPHRMGFLETSLKNWVQHTASVVPIFVTVDGPESHANAVMDLVDRMSLPDRVRAIRVGPATPLWVGPFVREGRHGVAANKNTGLECLMDMSNAQHLFLSDDDMSPKTPLAIARHVLSSLDHSMVMWGRGRLDKKSVRYERSYAEWTWPRGVLLYATRPVVAFVGGMDERFGPGGHEHAEWSRRIHQNGLTPAPFVSPVAYSDDLCTGMNLLWHSEDYIRRRRGEKQEDVTSIRREPRDWDMINKVMAERDGDTEYVSFRAHTNGREAGIILPTTPRLGAEN